MAASRGARIAPEQSAAASAHPHHTVCRTAKGVAQLALAPVVSRRGERQRALSVPCPNSWPCAAHSGGGARKLARRVALRRAMGYAHGQQSHCAR
eukprot:scaffold26117_cov56-Phaeocystis_antarctica.AAC.3